MTDQVFAIARSGMDVEWQRVEVIAANLANLNTTRTAEGVPYAARTLVSGPAFSGLLSTPVRAAVGSQVPAGGAVVLGVESSSAQPRKVFDPSHPHADAAGYVSYPGIDHVREMTSMLAAARAYEANLAAFNNARTMFQRAMQLGAK